MTPCSAATSPCHPSSPTSRRCETEPTRSLSAKTIDKLLLDSEPYLSCDGCFAQVDAYVERRIDEPDHVDAAMAAHLAACGACAEEAEALRELLEQDLS